MPSIDIIPNIENMVIQLVTLVILFLVFKRFGWAPTKRFLDKRQEIIASKFTEAEAAKEESLELKRKYEDHLNNASREAEHIIENSREEGKKVYENIILDARKEANQKLVRADEAIAQDVRNAKGKIKEDIIEIAVSSTERLIKKEINESDHQRLFDDFIANVGGEHV
jgi:F-type H+-transporting ATPase subunit b